MITARSGCTVIVPFREEMAKRHLKVAGDLGRVVFMEMDLRNTASIEESVRHSDIVYNLIGRDYPTKNFDLSDVHVEGTERIAEAVAKYDIDRYVHVSSHSAQLDSPSEFYRTKAQGEQVALSLSSTERQLHGQDHLLAGYGTEGIDIRVEPQLVRPIRPVDFFGAGGVVVRNHPAIPTEFEDDPQDTKHCVSLTRG